MIHEIDETLRTVVKEDVIKGSDVEVLFDAPTKDWSSRRNTPTIDIYLYDIREDLKRRQYGYVDVLNDEGRKAGARAIPRVFKLSYLVTAWTQRPEDEHRLLSAMLACFLKHDAIPTERLAGSLADMSAPLEVTVALPPPEDRALSDTWSALGGELKPSLDLVVYATIDVGRFIEYGALVLEEPRFSFRSGDAVEGGPRRGARGGSDGDGEEGESAPYRTPPELIPEETVSVGTDAQKGRIFTIRGTTEDR